MLKYSISKPPKKNIVTKETKANQIAIEMDKQCINHNGSIDTLLLELHEMDQNSILEQHGYHQINKICDTLQGQLILAEKTWNKQRVRVVIKQTDKETFEQRVAKQDDMIYCVEKNIVKEALILHHLTVDNEPIANYIVKFVDFFQSEHDYYLIMEYIDGINLKQFVDKAHQYINDGKLSLKEYQKIIKYIFWQLIALIRWLHDDMHCM